jgi:hypothetical protein
MLKIYFALLLTAVALPCEILQKSVLLKAKSHLTTILTYLLPIYVYKTLYKIFIII